MWIRVSPPQTKDIEADSLSVHVAFQKEREAAFNKQLIELRARQDSYESKELERKTFVFRTMVGAIISAVTSFVFLIIDYLK